LSEWSVDERFRLCVLKIRSGVVKAEERILTLWVIHPSCRTQSLYRVYVKVREIVDVVRC
jgi:hypothetical protein